jgi:hypothetical protein
MNKSPRKRGVFFLLLTILLAACGPQEVIVPITIVPSATPTHTITPTASPVWFPPTETPTPFPTRDAPPTPDMRPALGEMLLSDNFNDPSVWNLTDIASGSSAVTNNVLGIALLAPKAYVAATRNDVYLTDYYLEVTANPSLCMDSDTYGLILRAESTSDFYRLALSCDGQVRLDRIRGGTAASPLPWTFSAAVPQAVPATVQIGVHAAGDELHIFIGGQFQATVRDPYFSGGTIGVFARAAGDNAVSVTFEDMVVFDVTE